ncbi:MAG TPA: twin-arginine translocation signal domain-containing protein [Afifellaceae bacterium]|nr:twin-arginine translocation signal domain-containing protein [Afifellaceae bacterium]
MSKPDKKTRTESGSGRRDFLKLAGLTTLAGGAAIVTAKGEAEAAGSGPSGAGYQETDHVRTYYKLARF